MADLVVAESMTESKKHDHAVLPLDQSEIEKLLDLIHYVKNYKSKLNVLVNAPKATSETHKVDEIRLSRNLTYMCAQMTPETEGCTFETFQITGRASFDTTGTTMNSMVPGAKQNTGM
jgi:hypothetical protein